MSNPIPEEKIIEAIRAKRGLIAAAARALGVDRKTIYKHMHASEAVREAVKDARELMTDTAEAALYKAINEGQAWAVCFYLKTQGKDRGYIEKQQVEHSGSLPVLVVKKEE